MDSVPCAISRPVPGSSQQSEKHRTKFQAQARQRLCHVTAVVIGPVDAPLSCQAQGCSCHRELNSFLDGAPYCRGGNLVSLDPDGCASSSMPGCSHLPRDERLLDLASMSYAGEQPEPSGLRKADSVGTGRGPSILSWWWQCHHPCG